MNVQAFITIYSGLLRLYPAGFRETFGEEMLDVFSEAARDAQQTSAWAAWRFFLQECADFPTNVIREHSNSERLQAMIERILNNRNHSRRRMAGALGFAVAFALLEVLHGLYQLFQPNVGAYRSFMSVTQLDLRNAFPGRDLSIVPWYLDLAFLFIAGMAAGWIFSKAGGLKTVRTVLAGGVAMAGAWLMVGGVDLLLPQSLRSSHPGVIILFFLALLLINALSAVFFGWISGGSGLKKSVGLGVAGLAGYTFGFLGKVLTSLAVGVVFGLPALAIYRSAQLVTFLDPVFLGLIGFLLMAIVSSAVHGWIYGSWVGDRMTGGLPAPLAETPNGHSPVENSSIGYQTASGSTSSSGSGPASPAHCG
ncbi:MAG TPA: hypothetical protein VHO48_04905 [Anaerolineaceae bacterium]|nr:hypothetical protein [Anaerolineaceae bacterium]